MGCRRATFTIFTLLQCFIFHPWTNISTSQEMAARKAKLPLGKKLPKTSKGFLFLSLLNLCYDRT